MTDSRELPTATISDVAREAGVSVATVSRALNNKNVSEVLAARVRSAAHRLGYTPNASARNLRRQETRIWALIVPDITNPFFTSIAHGVSTTARKHGYKLLLCNSEEDTRVEREFIDLAIQEQASGVVFAPHRSTAEVQRLRDQGIPVVILDRTHDAQSDSVATDSRRAAYEATVHLLDQGWSRPACITGAPDTETATSRLDGYLEAMAARGMSQNTQFLHTDYTLEGGRTAASRLMSGETPPDALLVANSTLTLGALREIQARQLRLGVDLGLISFDDAPWASVIEPPLSVIAQPAFAIGEVAATLLSERMGGQNPEKGNVVLSAELIIRKSSLRQRG
jgi:LacI family transcriptional regulator